MSNVREGSETPGLMTNLRKNRVIQEFRWQELPTDMTVFLGVYNGAVHGEIIRRNLISQNWEGCNLLLVDNDSSDASWEMLNQLANDLSCPVRLVKNPRNVGGAGSWLSNLDLVSSKWVATMHQDDYYYPEHVQTLRKLILSTGHDVAICTTSMDRLVGDSKIQPFPRANWMLDASNSVQVFLSHLRFHSLPFPAAAFRKSAIESLPISWHDTSFGDTELVLRLSADFKFVSSPNPTMAYRENPNSESHILMDSNRASGQQIGLLKVFGSEAFEKVACSIPLLERDLFFLHALESVQIRLPDKKNSEPIKRFLAELLAIHWNYSSHAVNEFLKKRYEDEGNQFAVILLSEDETNRSVRSHLLQSHRTPPFNPPRRPNRLASWLFRKVSIIAMTVAASSGKRKDLKFRHGKRQ
jgi:glycosyltransferase involved in cell wall biosynthesis